MASNRVNETAHKAQMTEEEKPGSLFCAIGSETTKLADEEIKATVTRFLDTLGPREDVLLLPPDYTRFHSQAGKITQFVAEYYDYIPTNESYSPSKKQKMVHTDIRILPALGTHAPMTPQQIKSMFGEALAAKSPSPFMVHDWRNDVVTIGHVPAEMVSDATYGMVKEPWPAQLNRIVWEKRKHHAGEPRPLVLSIGQVVPHEVMGMANFNKNLFVGVGGVEAINLSHFIGAVHGMENMMGQPSNPLRSILNYASKHFLQDQLDLWYVLTVMGTDETTGEIEMKGLYIGNDIECYNQACELSLKVNFTLLERSPTKMVVHLDEDEFHSTWLGNKAIYRTRMAIGTGGEIVILAPGVTRFGEDDKVDELIRKYGYVGTPTIMKAMEDNDELKENLSAVAHLIHGSTEGRFRVTYCPGKLTKEEVESVGFQYGNLDEMMERYSGLKDGWCTEETEDGTQSELFYVSNPALGLWAVNSRFQKQDSHDEGKTANDTDLADPLLSTEQKEVKDSAGVGGWARPP